MTGVIHLPKDPKATMGRQATFNYQVPCLILDLNLFVLYQFFIKLYVCRILLKIGRTTSDKVLFNVDYERYEYAYF